MSMILNSKKTRSARRPNPWYGSGLARFVSQRRQDGGMTMAYAAALAGITVPEWAAVEAGWVPEDERVLCSIATALNVVEEQIILLALIARHNQPLSA